MCTAWTWVICANFNDTHPVFHTALDDWFRHRPCQPPKGSTSALSKPMFTWLSLGISVPSPMDQNHLAHQVHSNFELVIRCSSQIHPSKNASFAPSLYVYSICNDILQISSGYLVFCKTQSRGGHAVATLCVAKKILQEGRRLVPVQILEVESPKIH